MLNIILAILFFGGACIYIHRYIIKRLKRKYMRKKNKTNEKIIEIIKDTEIQIYNNTKLKKLKQKVRFHNILKLIVICSIILVAIYASIYCINNLKKYLYGITIVSASIITNIHFNSYKKNKHYKAYKKEFKNIIYDNFLSKLDKSIVWDKKITDLLNESNDFLSKAVLSDEYKKANFFGINDIINNIEYNYKKFGVYYKNYKIAEFEDYIEGMYNNKFVLEISDFFDYTIAKSNRHTSKNLDDGGIFCKVTLVNQNIHNEIKITNSINSFNSNCKRYTVTTMPEIFYNRFKMLAKNGINISKKISKETIDNLIEFDQNCKCNFNISIVDNKIYYRFKSIDSLEPRRIGKILDKSMLAEYASIIFFIINFSISICSDLENEVTA